MAESLSRLTNPRRPEPKEFAEGKESEGENMAESGDHMHAAAEAMHKAEPGSKHMIMSHDGYAMRSHGIDEQGNHKDTEEHNSAEEADEALHKFFGEEAQEPQHERDGEEPEEDQSLY